MTAALNRIGWLFFAATLVGCPKEPADGTSTVPSEPNSEVIPKPPPPKPVEFSAFFALEVHSPPAKCKETGFKDDWAPEVGNLTQVCQLAEGGKDEPSVFTEHLLVPDATNKGKKPQPGEWLRAYAILPRKTYVTPEAEESFLTAFSAKYGAVETEGTADGALGMFCPSAVDGQRSCVPVRTTYEPARTFHSMALAMLQSMYGMGGSFHVVGIENIAVRKGLDDEVARRRAAAASAVVK